MISIWGNIIDCLAFKLVGVNSCNKEEKINIVTLKTYEKNKKFFDELNKRAIVIVIDKEKDVFEEEVKRLSRLALGIELKV